MDSSERGGGFGYYDPQKDQLMPFFNEPSSPNWKFSNMMHAAFSDQQGNLWLSTRSHGLDKVIFNNDVFKTITVDPNIHSTINNDVRSIFEDSRQNLWVSAKGGKVFVYDKNRVQKGYLCRNGKIEYGAPIEGITYCMTEDSKKKYLDRDKRRRRIQTDPCGRFIQYRSLQPFGRRPF